MTNTVAFGSDDWLRLFHEKALARQDLLESFRDFEGPITLVMNPHRKKFLAGLIIWIDAGSGVIRKVEKLDFPDDKETKFTLTGSYKTWASIAQGETNIIEAIVVGSIQVEGEKALLIRQVQTADILGRIMKEMPVAYD